MLLNITIYDTELPEKSLERIQRDSFSLELQQVCTACTKEKEPSIVSNELICEQDTKEKKNYAHI